MDYRRPETFPWNYDRGEIIADGVVHAIGIGFESITRPSAPARFRQRHTRG
jgi:hypothetical protein